MIREADAVRLQAMTESALRMAERHTWQCCGMALLEFESAIEKLQRLLEWCECPSNHSSSTQS